jgi:beta-lactamase regulating signal transducer with metallopeptidase domain
MSTSGTLPLGSTLGAVVLLTACAFSSWPSWLGRSDSRTENSEVHNPASRSQDPYLNPYVEHLMQVSTPLGTFDIPTWAEPFLLVAPPRDATALPDPTATDMSSNATSINWIWLLVGVAILIGLVRVIGGLWAVRLFVRTSRPLKSQSLLEQVDLLRAEMGCTKSVEVRECPQMATAATVGWRRPVVLLSDSWQSWTPEQLRSVLAHEIAHITRGDFLATVAAQVGVVLHFYHPLVHWLANRLRLEQELAADALAAKVVGGSRAYLNAIGELALKQSSEPVGWPAHSFLPTRRTFLRRIEMLRDLKFLSGGTSRLAKWATLASVAAVTLVAIGLRPPVGDVAASTSQAADSVTPVVAATEAAISQPSARVTLDPRYVPASAFVVIAARIDTLSQQFENLKTTQQIPGDMPGPFQSVKGCEQATIVLLAPNDVRQGPDRSTGVCLTFGNQADRDAAVGAIFPVSNGPNWQKTKLLLAEYEVIPATGQARYLPDEKTLILANKDLIQSMILTGSKSLSPLTQTESWKAAANGSVAIAVDTTAVQKLMATLPPPNPIVGMFSPLWDTAVSHTLGLAIGDQTLLTLTSQAKDAGGAQKVEATQKASVAMLANMLGNAKNSPDPNTKKLAEGLLPILEGHKITTQGTVTTLTCSANLDLVASLLAPPITQARAAAQRVQQQNNMKQILMALHNYHEVFGHFPPAAIVDPQSGVARSWRVEILPFIEGAPLWNEYKKNEPWDSESNKKILAQMPRVFRHPTQAAEATNTSIFAACGDGFAFQKDDKIGLKLHDITDGTSATIAIIEAQADIPWTKPEELSIDLSQGAPKSFGFDPTAFAVGLCDGSVQMIARTIEPQLLKVMFTRNGGEVLQGFDQPLPTVPVPAPTPAVPATPR